MGGAMVVTARTVGAVIWISAEIAAYAVNE
jgi:hypothetical protein